MLLDSINPTTHKHARARTRTERLVHTRTRLHVWTESVESRSLGRGARHDRCLDKLANLVVLMKGKDVEKEKKKSQEESRESVAR